MKTALLGRTQGTRIGGAAIAVSLLCLLVVFACVRSDPRAASLSAYIWCIAQLFSFWGWGKFVERSCFRCARADWGLSVGWGISVVVLIGGLLNLLCIASAPSIHCMIAIGWVLALGNTRAWQLREDVRAQALVALALTGCLLAVASLDFLGWGSLYPLNSRDDGPAYAAMVREIVERGSSIQPFSFRRLSVMGGHEYLMALQASGGTSFDYLHVTDGGLAPMVVIGLALGSERRLRLSQRAVLGLAAAYVLFLPSVRSNISSHTTTLLLALVLYRTLVFERTEARRWSWDLLIGMVAASLCTLKNSVLLPVLVILALSALPGRERTRLVASAKSIFTQLSAMAFCLAPWMALSFISGRSPFFPLTQGNYRVGYGVLQHQHGTAAEVVQALRAYFDAVSAPVWITFVIFAIAATRNRRVLLGMLAAPLLVALSCAILIPYGPTGDVVRYTFGFQHALVIAACHHVAFFARIPARGGGRAIAATTIIILAVLESEQAVSARARFLSELLAPTPKCVAPFPLYASTRDAQSYLPPGAAVFVMSENAYEFDFARNKIFLYDLPGALVPEDVIHGPMASERFKSYLRGRGIEYAILQESSVAQTLYSPAEWNAVMKSGHRAFLQMARESIAGIERVRDLESNSKVLHRNYTLTVLDLR